MIRPGELGDMDRLTEFLQDELAYLPLNTHVGPLLDLFSHWEKASSASYSKAETLDRLKERLHEQEASLKREAKVERKQMAFRAFLDASIIWPARCRSVSLPVPLERQREVNPKNKGEAGTFVSEKLGRPVQYELLLERQFLLWLEESEAVRFYLEQPLRLTYKAEERQRVYVPDVFFVLADGRGVVAEVIPRHTIWSFTKTYVNGLYCVISAKSKDTEG